MSKVILITGASRGFGKIWANAFLKRGDKVVAAVRDINSVKDLVSQYGNAVLPVKLDVNDRAAAFSAIKKAKETFGRIDVLINNAGYGQMGAIEEISEQQARDQFETNVFGTLWTTQAVLPVMREQGSGHIINISSVLGLVGLPILAWYNASKFAVEGLSESLAGEVAGFGIKVSIIEPNGFSTEFGGPSAKFGDPISAYGAVKEAVFANFTEDFYGQPTATIDAVLQLVDNTNPPLRLLLGKKGLPWVKQVYDSRLAEFETYKEVSAKAHGH
ncbi:MAG TPA: SDR family NAD(P)-dependent oxidoreductase [Puia sp.]|nr:SDR family NAD(P)-dependent oxidoreductase [Puia sp.]